MSGRYVQLDDVALDWPPQPPPLMLGGGGPKSLDLTAELITHRFTPGSKEVLLGWYPRTKLEMDEESRSRKHGKFGAVKYVYRPEVMTELRSWFEANVPGRILYWT